MEAYHSNLPYDLAHKLVVGPPMTGSSTLTAHEPGDDMQNSSSTESLMLPVETTKNKM